MEQPTNEFVILPTALLTKLIWLTDIKFCMGGQLINVYIAHLNIWWLKLSCQILQQIICCHLALERSFIFIIWGWSGAITKYKQFIVWTYRDGGDSDSLHSGVSEQVPQGRAYLCCNQVVGGSINSGGDVLYGFCNHVMNYGIIL